MTLNLQLILDHRERDLFEQIKLIDKDISPEINEKKWKLTFTKTRDLDDQEKEN